MYSEFKLPVRPNTPQNCIEDTLQGFGIKAKVINTVGGFTVTRYEVEIEGYVQYSKVSKYAPEIAGRLGATSVQIVAPIPNKTCIGIDVTTQERHTLPLRDCWEYSEGEEIPIYIGGTVGGEVITTDLVSSPHMLVAGTTGSGKSVFLNSMLASIVRNTRPEDVRLLLIDMKLVELRRFARAPHVDDFVTDADLACRYLEHLIVSMNNRYKMLADAGVENLTQYNQIRPSEPRLVVIIDELGDLMLSQYKERAEAAISILTQKARAAGIHLVLCTQRPCSQIITGVIKANVPTRIAFTAASLADSRVILDIGGAEKLLGMGDLLYKGNKNPHMVRAQGPFITNEEIDSIIEQAVRKIGA